MSYFIGDFRNEKKYSYQHLQGVMLVNLNKLAFENNLPHSTYRVMGVLISHWNYIENKAFPSLTSLSKSCCMSKATLVKNIKLLEKSGLLQVLKIKGLKNNYFPSALLFNSSICQPLQVLQTRITCKTSHDIKPNRILNIHDDKKYKCLQ